MKVAALYVKGASVVGGAVLVTLGELNVDHLLVDGNVGEGDVGKPDACLLVYGVLKDGGCALCRLCISGVCKHELAYRRAVNGEFGDIVVGGNVYVLGSRGNHKLVDDVGVAFKVEKGFFKVLDSLLISLLAACKNEKLVADKLDGKALVSKVVLVLFELITAV